jgi:hypothetical protein
MKRNLQVEQKVDRAMQSLDGLAPAEANPYLYTRIQQRLQNKQQSGSFSSMMFRLAVVLIIFIAINVFTFEKFSANTGSSKTTIESFATDYDLQVANDEI